MLQIKKEMGATDAITLGTAAAIAISTIYNWGYYARLETSLLALMTWQDLLYGAAIGLVTLLLGAFLGMFFSEVFMSRKGNILPFSGWFSDVPVEAKHQRKHVVWFSIWLATFVVSLAAMSLVPEEYSALPFWSGYLSSTAMMGLATFLMSPLRALIMFGVLVACIAFMAGRMNFDGAVLKAASRPGDIVTLTNGKSLQFSVIRLTSEYAVGKKEDSFILLPLSQVGRIWRSTNEVPAREKM